MSKDCDNCQECLKDKKQDNGWPVLMSRMVTCIECGNKRSTKSRIGILATSSPKKRLSLWRILRSYAARLDSLLIPSVFLSRR